LILNYDYFVSFLYINSGEDKKEIEVRVFKRLEGQFKGNYKIYDSVKEFEENEKGKMYKYEYLREEMLEKEVKVGEWVETIDGYVTQILRISKYEDVGKKKKVFRVYIPNMVAKIIFINHKMTYMQRLYGALTGRNLQGGDPPSFKSDNKLTRAKIRSDLMHNIFDIGMGIKLAIEDVVNKYDKVGDKINRKGIEKVLRGMLTEEAFLQEIRKRDGNFLEKFNDDEAFSNDKLIEYIKDLMDNVKKGSKEHLETIELLLKIAIGLNKEK